jgi:hypothetical protein
MSSWLHKVYVSNILMGQYSSLHNKYLHFTPRSIFSSSTPPSLIHFKCFFLMEWLFRENGLRSSFSFQLVIKPKFILLVGVCVMKSMHVTYVHHLLHVLVILNHHIGPTNGTTLVAFSNTISCYKSINKKIMNYPHVNSL